MTSAPVRRYRGRFAPSPTGLLHAGSLLTAVASCLDARRHGGEWWLRIEDLDPPREMPGASSRILATLEAFGFEWDGELVYQHDRHERYAAALERLIAAGVAYPCACTRKDIARVAVRGIDGPVYPGTCRHGLPAGQAARAWRLRVPAGPVRFIDRIVGEQVQDVARDVGDFVLRRADGLWAYQLAVVVDDADQGMTDVVRGADLLDSTPRQIVLMHALGVPVPRHAHVPLVVNAAGEKLSKQTLAPAICADHAADELLLALRRLNQSVPGSRWPLAELWAWAHEHFDFGRIGTRPVTAAGPEAG